VLYRDLYRGVITWNRTRKRDKWGLQRQAPPPTGDWLEIPAPHLQIVTEDPWRRTHERPEAVRGVYLRTNRGQAFGRPALGGPSKYLLTNLALCGCCGGSLRVRSRKHGNERRNFYGCAAYHERGRTVCANSADVPMDEANYILIEALLDELLDAQLLADVVDEAMRLAAGNQRPDRRPAIDAEIARLEQERNRLVTAIAAGGTLDGLLAALKEREARLADLHAEREAAQAERRTEAVFDEVTTRRELMDLASQWRQVLASDPENARPVVTMLLNGRVTITPTGTPKQWEIQGTGTLLGLFSREIFPSGWRPHRDADASAQWRMGRG
jgi:Recombinase zinc beta ribbon domain